uniref:Ig-like domain-containing protein n=1 Tax=Rhinolophus ferrumequinum TaxID=59479 RepID=A0A671EUC3_RHIFE
QGQISHRDSLPGLNVGPRTRVQAGTLPKPTAWAEPGSVIPWGSSVTIWCQGALGAKEFRLDRKGILGSWDRRKPLEPGNKAKFSIPHMTERTAGGYFCYYLSPAGWSESSDPLELVVTGMYDAPSLSAQPSPVVASGEKVSFSCSSHFTGGAFHLLKDRGADQPIHMDSRINYGRWPAQAQALFPVGPVNTSHGGTYRCYGSSSSNPNVWSHPSKPLPLKVTGMYEKPSLSAQPGPSVSRGENVTLQCRSETSLDNFHLHKVGSPAPPRHLRLGDTAAPSQANFRISPVTSAHGGTYRCYSSRGTSPYLLSHASDPLQLVVSGERPQSLGENSTCPASHYTQEYTMGNVTRMGVAGLILVVLGMLLFEAWHSQRRTHSAARTGTQRHPTIKVEP